MMKYDEFRVVPVKFYRQFIYRLDVSLHSVCPVFSMQDNPGSTFLLKPIHFAQSSALLAHCPFVDFMCKCVIQIQIQIIYFAKKFRKGFP